jgi:hypothetical protein
VVLEGNLERVSFEIGAGAACLLACWNSDSVSFF